MSLDHEQTKSHAEGISNIKSFIDQYNWKELDFPSHIKDWKKFESNNKSIALNILYEPHNTEEIRHAYISLYNSDREDQVILLRITDGKKWHYLAVKKLSALLRGITSKHNGGSYCINRFHSYSTKEKLKNLRKFHLLFMMINNPKKLSTTKINKHTPSGYSLFTHCSFDTTKNKFNYYRGKNCMKNFCLDLREHVTKIISYEKKEMIPFKRKRRENA